jgi:hypothetical protein
MSFNTSYTVNNGNYANFDLAQIFPPYLSSNKDVVNKDLETFGTVLLQTNKSLTSNYVVIPTYFYSLPGGSGGTYNWQNASISAQSILIYNKTSTQFQYYFQKGSGDYWNGGISLLIIYKP